MFETDVFGAPLEELKKNELTPNSRFFSKLELLEIDVFGTTYFCSCWSSPLGIHFPM